MNLRERLTPGRKGGDAPTGSEATLAAEGPTGNFHGRPPRGRPDVIARATEEVLDGEWTETSRYDRTARVVDVERLTGTGTVRLEFEVADNHPFSFRPGQYVGIEHRFAGGRRRRSPYCIMSTPKDDRRFELLVRVVPEGPVSRYLADLERGDQVVFRGPLGPYMIPPDADRDLVLMATGVGVGPFLSLARHLLDAGFDRQITLFWGLRNDEDICLTEGLDELGREHRNFSYRISLSQPSPAWDGMRGRITHSVPPVLEHLGDTRFYLCGNGAMTEEMRLVLSDLGVSESFIYAEPYFNRRHRPDPALIAAIRARFVARDLFSPQAHRSERGFILDDTDEAGGNADPLSPSDMTLRVPDFLGPRLSHSDEPVGAGRK